MSEAKPDQEPSPEVLCELGGGAPRTIPKTVRRDIVFHEVGFKTWSERAANSSCPAAILMTASFTLTAKIGPAFANRPQSAALPDPDDDAAMTAPLVQSGTKPRFERLRDNTEIECLAVLSGF